MGLRMTNVLYHKLDLVDGIRVQVALKGSSGSLSIGLISLVTLGAMLICK